MEAAIRGSRMALTCPEQCHVTSIVTEYTLPAEAGAAGASRAEEREEEDGEEAVDEVDDEEEGHVEGDEEDDQEEEEEEEEEEDEEEEEEGEEEGDEADDDDEMLDAMQYDNAESMRHLIDMGFPENRARKALQINRGHVQLVREGMGV